MSDNEQFRANIDHLVTAQLKGGLWKAALTTVLTHTSHDKVVIQGYIDELIRMVRTQILDAPTDRDMLDGEHGIGSHVQDALAEFRAEARDLLT